MAFVKCAVRHCDSDTVKLGSFFNGKASTGGIGEAGVNGAGISVVTILSGCLAGIERIGNGGETRVAGCDGARIGSSGGTVKESPVKCWLTVYGNTFIDGAWVGVFEVERVSLAGTREH